ncbi:hypothetical protein [Mycobacteroides abscessus]|uniref:hypothetical protein n=1 Tax=Mycobacteroides abscessus TaxID=36809 RepID=UPI000C2580FC|nr:hypothetical protein [Mycobacteroides abscessus]
MPDLSDAFEAHLRAMPDTDWDALVKRVRPAAPVSGVPLANETQGDPEKFGRRIKGNEGLDEARRRGYITD